MDHLEHTFRALGHTALNLGTTIPGLRNSIPRQAKDSDNGHKISIPLAHLVVISDGTPIGFNDDDSPYDMLLPPIESSRRPLGPRGFSQADPVETPGPITTALFLDVS
ncbi:hypothetical protein N7510_006407 [Penicillium lagena]|uniref:uncharacterized protein n=1 Tax=Penicillium lagena TaxID=94218 RepID=UPI0025409FA7|nr:uncharacterized protein N7510_006407 [Penicillium lagena]KAJ5613213.1 hypothetical protein N7510_006407 [Penicillium lagena]